MGKLYDNITALCAERGIKPSKMCADIGISRGLITDLKMGRKNGVTAVTAQKIASYFGVSVGYLLGEEDISEKNKPPLPVYTENEGCFDYVSLSNEVQAQLYEIFEASIKKHDTTDGFAAAHSDLKKNILLRLKEKRMSMASRAELLYLARFLEVSEEADSLIRELPKLEEPYSSMYRQFHEKNVIKIAGRDGSYKERTLTDEQLSALTAILDQMPDASDDL